MRLYMPNPQMKLEVGSPAKTFTNWKSIEAKVTRTENAFDLATLIFADTNAQFRDTVKPNQSVKISVKDASDLAWSILLDGIIRSATEVYGKTGEFIHARCDGAGYGLAEMLVGSEYGSQAPNGLDTMFKILSDPTCGIIPKYVNKILGGSTNSGYVYTAADVDNIAGTVPYLYFPYKPASKCLCDLIDLMQSILYPNAGAHWIVVPAANPKLLVTRVGAHSATAIADGWPTYLSNDATKALMQQGIDFLDFNFETMVDLANYILYYAPTYRPIGMDLCEGNVADWDSAGGTLADEASIYMVGTKSIKHELTATPGQMYVWYPKTKTLAYDLTKLGGMYSIPTINFWIRYHGAITGNLFVDLVSTFDFVLYHHSMFQCVTQLASSPDIWTYITLPVGPYWNYGKSNAFQGSGWQQFYSPSWANINGVMIEAGVNGTADIYIDGLHFEGWVTRAAYNGNRSPVKMRIINDPFAKSDTFIASDDTGTAAMYALAELLRAQTQPIVGSFMTSLRKDAIPGQLIPVKARIKNGVFQIDTVMRSTTIVHNINNEGLSTQFQVTSDISNSMARQAFDAPNEIQKNQRPEYQDRQSTGIKLRDVDVTQIKLEKNYPS